jgi:hypothetical protein
VGIGSWLGVEVDVAFLPVAPVPGGLLADGGVGVCEQSGVGVDDAAVTISFGQCIPEACPRRREQPADIAVIQATSLVLVVVIATNTIARTRSGWVWA